MEPIVLPEARDHGVADEDMFHAIRNAIARFEQEDDMMMHIGPDRAGRILEVGTINASDYPGVQFIPHAMPARPKYLRRLPKR